MLETEHSELQGLCGLTGADKPLLLGEAAERDAEMTHARREYLAEVYRLQTSGAEAVTTTALAEELDVSPPAAARMMQRLAREGYLRRRPYRGVMLTPEGEREALRSIRRHRLLEAFLVTVMKFGWDEVHDHAHALEGVINEKFEDRMDELAGYPQRCPHGDPIPTKDGQMPTLHDQPLTEAPLGAASVLQRVKTHDTDKLRYLAEVGLVPGTRLHITHRAPLNGTLRLKVQGTKGEFEHVIGTELAQALRVEVVEK